MLKVLITGGTGFVGEWLKIKKPDAYSIYSIGRTKYEKGAWTQTKWDYIIHLAPTSPLWILRQATKHNTRVLYASSGVVYHPENWARKEYLADKLEGEKLCTESGVDVVVARLFTFYGKHLDDKKAITIFNDAAKNNLPLVITGDGSTVRTYMHGSEMADWMWAILAHGKTGESYDVGSDKPVTMLGLAQDIIKTTASQSPIYILNKKDPMPYYIPKDIEKTKLLLDKT